ncbi:hypothetical protein GCM10010411_03010 [Actinomadura fulvescens]|uniref:Uncharacterized protein n=1 Tax=Actinomadura fulvescens TaxID=46160 RepID=A0ABN3PBK3_9ACTN
MEAGLGGAVLWESLKDAYAGACVDWAAQGEPGPYGQIGRSQWSVGDGDDASARKAAGVGDPAWACGVDGLAWGGGQVDSSVAW